jgi:uncharacterized linocin/CFP29 family protein
MDLLKRKLAPILPAAWEEIDTEARRVLALNLGGRKVVDFDGPHGWKFAALNLGRLDLLDEQPEEGVHVGIRRVLPLTELRIPIRLDLMELDTVARGGEDPELEPVVEASEKIALTEDRAIFYGRPELGITGIVGASPHEPLELPDDPADFPDAVVRGSEVLRRAGIDGPYALVLGPEAFNQLAQAAEDGYPIRKRVAQIIAGPIVWSQAVEGAVLISVRGGDFVLTVGQDLAIGYAAHDRDEVELYLTESFTFRVLEPAAAVALEHGA